MKSILLAWVSLSVIYACATPTITGVTAQQRYPWNGKVDISYTVTGDIAATAKEKGMVTSLKVTATDCVAGANYVASTSALSGDTGLAAATHHLVWDMSADGLTFKSSNVVFSVSCEATPALYCVIDLSAGANASSYPITYLSEPPSGGFNVDLYKTTKLVLRRIEAGTFIKGEDQSNESHRVILTKSFYVGIFEMTQKQYVLIMGSNPSRYTGDKRPVEKVSYNMIRGSSNGAQWPLSSAVDSSSVMGRLRARAGLDFDLPTVTQWEYACRAGTTSKYNNGGNSENDLKLVGRYSGNMSAGRGGYSYAHTSVGSYQPNTWGLYDMHGNISELCLDWGPNTMYGLDPQGPSSGTRRGGLGGNWQANENACTSFYWASAEPEAESQILGFRLARTLSE